MNNKGFTLVELLAVITIIGIISGISVVAYNSFINNSRDRVYKTYEDTMKRETEMYLINHSDKIPLIGETTTIMLNDLDIEPFINPNNKNDKCLESKVNVTRNNDVEENINLNYQVCLICNDYKTSNSCN